jgi:hypothetical protein
MSEERRYTGHPAPEEWSKTYAQRLRNYTYFLVTVQEVYPYEMLAGWFAVHKETVKTIMHRKGFCSGFWYNLVVRLNAFQCEMVKDGKVKFLDVWIERTDLMRQAFRKAQMQGELNIPDNPYVAGGKKEDLNPYTGLEKLAVTKKKADNTKSQQNNNKNNNNRQGGGSRWEPYKGNRERDDRDDNPNRSNEGGNNNKYCKDAQGRNRSYRGPQDKGAQERDQGGKAQRGRKLQQ